MANEPSTPPSPAGELKARRRAGKPRATTAAEQHEGDAPPVAAPPVPLVTDPGYVVAVSSGVISLPTSSTGISHHSLGGPATLVGSFTSDGVPSSKAGDYVTPERDGYVSSYPRGAQQPTTVRVWSAGMAVRKDVFLRHGGDACASRPQDAQPVNEPGGGLPPVR